MKSKGSKGVEPIDTEARRAIRDDLDSTLIVEAAAGTGKTTELINRILRVLETGRATMPQIVAVTFTEKAAGELKLRLRGRLEEDRSRATDSDVRERLERALASLEEAHVNTIHGFCAELLRERPVEGSVDPLFTVLTEPQSNRLYARAFGAWLQDTLKNPPEGVRRALRRSSFGGAFGSRSSFGSSSDGAVDRLRGAGRALAEMRDFTHPWRRPPFDRTAAIDRLLSALHHLADLTAEPLSSRDNLFIDTDGVRRLSRQIALEQSFGQRDLDGWESRLVDLTRDRGLTRTRKGIGYKFGKATTRTEVLAARDSLVAELQQFRKDADADLAACLQEELGGATARYQELKVSAGALDFTDLLTLARRLIRDNADVRLHLQRKFTHLFVDEFQDTDPVQAEILLLLAAGVPGKLFIVGDPKQSIYRFRGTDVATYWRVSRELAEQGGRVLQLTTSYRSVPELQRFVNAAFGDEMKADERTLQAGYVPQSPYRPGHDKHPAVIALPVPRPYGRSTFMKPSAKAIDESLADAVGAFIAWLVDTRNGWGIEPKDIAVLFRRFVSFGEDVTRGYIDAIEARSIPHLLVGGKSFHGREEVETVRAALAAIEWPDDELSVFATLKGSLFAIDDELLLEFRHRFGAFHPFRVPRVLGGNSGQALELAGEPTAHLLPIADGLRLLQLLHRGRNYRPVADTIGRLLDETRAHVGFVLRPAGEQALANVLHVAELARQYEAGGGISFRGFIDELRSASESEAAEAPIVEEGSDGVRLMTVHKAKGLEFPVVILADLTCRMNRDDASRYLDGARNLCALKIGGWAPHELHEHGADEVARDQAEGVRLAYVAATRARDLLVVPALGDGPWEGGWFAPLNRALYPPAADRRAAQRGLNCPLFRSKDSVLERPHAEPAAPTTVCPGSHAFPGGYSVVWWDPGTLDLDRAAPFGLRRDDLIVKDVPKHVVADGRTHYDRWLMARADARETGAAPSIAVKTVRAWASEDGSLKSQVASRKSEVSSLESQLENLEVSIVDLRLQTSDFKLQTSERRGGLAFGVLVHELLAQAPFDATDGMLADIAHLHACVLDLTIEDELAAVRAARRVFDDDLIRRAADADRRGACRRETPATLTLDNGIVVEGVVDLAFEHAGRWTVVDYKTDRELVAGEETYRRQVALYAAAIARAVGAPADAVLVRV